MVVGGVGASQVTRGVPAFSTSAVSHIRSELPDQNHLVDPGTTDPADPQLSTVVTGATAEGQKEVITIGDGLRESTESWREVLRDLRDRGLKCGARLAVGDGALGFWGALTEIYPESRHQRCWMHKTGNVLNALPKSLQSKAKAGLHEIWMAETRESALTAFDTFVKTYQVKYPNAAEKLTKDREALLAFYDFPAEHWLHVRTTNPIESTFASVRHRTTRSRNCLSRATFLG